MSLNGFNDDILVKIFNHLPLAKKFVCQRVSKQWRTAFESSVGNQKSLAIVPSAMSKVSTHFSVDRKIAAEMKISPLEVLGEGFYWFYNKDWNASLMGKYSDIVSLLLKKCKRVKNIELFMIDPDIVNILEKEAPKLEFLAIHEIEQSVDDNVFQSCPGLCERIKKLAIGANVGDQVDSILLRLKELRKFFVVTSEPNSNHFLKLETLTLLGGKIEQVILSNCNLNLSFDTASKHEIKEQVLNSNLMRLKQVEILGTVSNTYDDEIILVWLTGMKMLRRLSLNCEIFEDENSQLKLKKLSTSVKFLTLVGMKEFDKLGPNLGSILKHKSQLQSLHLEYKKFFRIDDLECVVENCPDLTHLCLKTLLLDKVGLPGDREYTDPPSLLKELKYLKVLELPHAEISDENMQSILFHCPNVSKFNFTHIRTAKVVYMYHTLIDWVRRRSQNQAKNRRRNQAKNRRNHFVAKLNLEGIQVTEAERRQVEMLKHSDEFPRALLICDCPMVH